MLGKRKLLLRVLTPRLNEENIAPFIAQFLVSYEVTQSEISQLKVTIFAHVNKV